MTTFAAEYTDNLQFESLYVSSNVTGTDDHVTIDGFQSTLSVIEPTITDAQPVSEPQVVLGTQAAGFSGSGNSIFYNRILIEPERLDLGSLVSSQTRLVSVWNGYFFSKTMDSFAGIGTEGITVTEPGLPPFTVYPLQELTYTFAIDLIGPPQVDATYTWTLDGVDFDLPVTGSRVILWPFAPQWAQPVVESLAWKTRIARSYDGTEQRASMLHQARRRLSYNFNVVREETQRFDNITWGWQNRAFAVPNWQYKCKTTAAVSAGATSLPVITASAGFVAGNLAALVASNGVFEVIEIETVNSNSLIPKRPTEKAWPAGSALYPASLSHIEGNIPTTRLTDNALTGSVRFLSHPIDSSPYTPVAAAPSTYNGYEILTKQPNWAGGLDASRDYPNDVRDNMTGRVDWSTTNETPVLLRRFTWTFKSRAEVEDFREFLQRRKGQFTPVYIPTWHQDFTLLQTINAGDTTMIVKDFGFAAQVGLDTAKAHLYFRGNNGVNYSRPIAGVAQDTNSVSVNFSSPLGVGFAPEAVKIHLLMLWRLASDEVQINWLTDQVATVEATFQAVSA